MEIQYSMKKLSVIQYTFLPNKMHFKVLYIRMYDYMKEKITTVINII